MSGQEWQGAAGDEVRRCVAWVQKKSAAAEQAAHELQKAQAELDAAERDLDIAKRVYFAGRKDLRGQAYALKVTPQKREWLKALSKHHIFGAAEMRDAATAVGWEANGGALRTLASEYRKAGYFINVAHGVIRLDRDYIEAALGLILDPVAGFDQEALDRPDQEGTHGSSPWPQEFTTAAYHEPGAKGDPEDEASAETVRKPQHHADDYMDDDTPF